MGNREDECKLTPMSETMLYILFSLQEIQHGYGIMLFVKMITKGRIVLGAGTIYQSLSKLEKAKLICFYKEEDRKRLYQITKLGQRVLAEEVSRIHEMYENMKGVLK